MWMHHDLDCAACASGEVNELQMPVFHAKVCESVCVRCMSAALCASFPPVVFFLAD